MDNLVTLRSENGCPKEDSSIADEKDHSWGVPGGITARRLNNIFCDTRGLFPASRASMGPNGQVDKYNSIYEMTYNSPYWSKGLAFRASLPDAPQTPNLIPKSIPLHVGQPIAFMKWKIPDYIIEGREGRPGKDILHVDSVANKSIQTKRPSASSRASNQPIQFGLQRSRTSLSSVLGSNTPSISSKPGSPMKLKREQTLGPLITHKKEVVTASAPQVTALLKEACPSERRVIEKALVLGDPFSVEEAILRQMEPEIRTELRKWIQISSPHHIREALNVLRKLIASKTVTKDDIKDAFTRTRQFSENRLEESITMYHPKFSKRDAKSHLKVIRLLTPETRKNKWIYSSWHHMPPYPDTNPNEYNFSHYEQPQRAMPRHYRIHPDMG